MTLPRRAGASVPRLATFPLPAHRTRRADFPQRALQRDHAPCTRARPSPAGMARRLSSCAPSEWHCSACFPAVVEPGRKPVHALPPTPLGPAYAAASGRFPSLPHGVAPALPDFYPGSQALPLPASFALSLTAPRLRPLPSAGITRLPRYYGPLRHPARPGLSLTGFRLARATPPSGLPVLLLSPSCVHATVNTPAEPTGARIARFPAAGSLPRFVGGSASALPFSRPAQRSLPVVACTLAEPPTAALLHRVLQSESLPPRTAPIATGWSDSCRAGFTPRWETAPFHGARQYLGCRRDPRGMDSFRKART